MKEKYWVLWKGEKPWRWAVVMHRVQAPRWRVGGYLTRTPNNHWLWHPRCHVGLNFGPFRFMRHNAGLHLGFGKWELTTHW